MNLRTLTTEMASTFTLTMKDPKRTVSQPRRSISSRKQVGKNQAVPPPMVDIQFDKIVH